MGEKRGLLSQTAGWLRRAYILARETLHLPPDEHPFKYGGLSGKEVGMKEVGMKTRSKVIAPKVTHYTF